ncbi:hypothetical protein EYC80_002808 [Monilinia laxa]|uniref:Uncharacterized protein n=1 Tax=Monilinia laxa TaxID=61186 RepID=A0A5N6KBS0_MONLA|nr:hypothetical protein EYC80_002808 [Monilinia laxa]
MLFLSSVRRLFNSRVVENHESNVVNAAMPSWLDQSDPSFGGRTERSESQAQKMEHTDPKQLAPIESTPDSNAPMADNRQRGPSSLPEVSDSAYPSPRKSHVQALETSNNIDQTQHHKKRNRKLYVALIVATVIVMGLSLGVGLGVGLYKPKSVTRIQTRGAINRSGVVAIDLDETTKITAYTQRYDGVIVRSEYQDGIWAGGSNIGDLDTLKGNFNGETLVARNGTPLMALSYEFANELLWHVFYVTADNYLSDWINSNISQGWSQGTIRSGDFQVSNSSTVGLSACVNRKWYGAPYNIAGLGIRLYYGASNNTIQELGWNLDGQTTWFKGASFANSNGEGGVECTVRGASITYVWMENLQGQLQQMWYDFNASANTSSHPTQTWVAGLTYPDIVHNSAISAINDFTVTPPTKNVHFQAQNLSIVQIISNGTAENDTWERSFVVGTEKGVNGTRLGSVVLNSGLGGQEIHVLFQTNTTNMVDFVRGLTDRNWAVLNVPVGA